MILDAFQKKLSAKWDEFIIWDSMDQKRLFYSRPLPLAFSELEFVEGEGNNGEVVIAPALEKHWEVIMREYSISRNAAEVLLFIARKNTLVIKINNTTKNENVNFIVFKDGLDELEKAGVVDIKTIAGTSEYELSHDLLASVVLGKNFERLWEETQCLRIRRKHMDKFKSSYLFGDDDDDL